jgi:hypothetical protein
MKNLKILKRLFIKCIVYEERGEGSETRVKRLKKMRSELLRKGVSIQRSLKWKGWNWKRYKCWRES